MRNGKIVDLEIASTEKAAEDRRRRSLSTVVRSDEDRLFTLNIDFNAFEAQKVPNGYVAEFHKLLKLLSSTSKPGISSCAPNQHTSSVPTNVLVVAILP